MIEGLEIFTDIISEEEEKEIIECIVNEPWNTSLRRLTQHYGYVYNYVSPYRLEKTKDPPLWLRNLIQKLLKKKYLTKKPEQIIINRYLVKEGIGPHIDSTVFGDTICSLSLGSGCDFEFSKDRYEIYHIVPRTFIRMSKDARYKWKHGIAKKKTDIVNGKRIKRKTRYSITFRNLAK